MVEHIGERLAAEFPEYVEMNQILHLAAQTWPRFGISAAEIAALSAYEVALLKVALAE